MAFETREIPGQHRAEKLHWVRNTFLALLVAGGLCCAVLVTWLLRPLLPPESPDLTARRQSPDNAYPVLCEALKLFPEKPAPLKVQDKENYKPARDSMGRRLGIARPDDDPLLLDYLAKCEPVVQKTREALERPYCLFPDGIMQDGSGLFGPLLSESALFKFSALGGLLGARAIEAFQLRKDMHEAQKYAFDLLRLGVLLDDDVMLQLGEGMIEGTVGYLIPHLREAPEDVLRSSLASCRRLRESLRPPAESVEFAVRVVGNMGHKEDDWFLRLVSFAFGARIRVSTIRSARTLKEILEAAALPYPEYERRMGLHPVSASPGIRGIDLKNIADMIVLSAGQRETLLAGLETGIALELYKQGQGRYPDTLDDLKTVTPEGAPLDPLSGHPFIYRSNGVSDYTLYSVGPDLKDDGGDAEKDCVLSHVSPDESTTHSELH